MELKHLIEQFTYRIEPKPEGGFIARCTDPAVPPLEAPTREELQQQIQARLGAALQEKFPGLNFSPLLNKHVEWQVHIDRKPGGGFTVHSDQQGNAGVSPATEEKIDHFAEELLGFVEKRFPELSQALASQAGARNINLVGSETGKLTLNASGALGIQNLLPTRPIPSGSEKPESAAFPAIGSSAINSVDVANNPITPEAGGNWKFFRSLLFFVIMAVLMYFFFYRR